MKQSNNLLKAEYGFFDGQKYVVFVNATDLKGAVCIMVKRLMKLPENSPVFNEDGSFNHRVTLQNFVNDYGVCILENSDNDYGKDNNPYTTVSAQEAADHLINTYGWITLNRSSVNNSEVYEELVNLLNRWEIKDYTK